MAGVFLATTVSAAEPEFPDDWYFDPEGGVRTAWEGKPAVAWSAETWIGEASDLDDCRGKVVVLDFWATWCGPCVASIPKNIELASAYPDDLVFIGMHSATSGWDKAPQMIEDREINYPVALDTGDTGDAYGITAFPTYIIIDRQGIVRAAGVTPNHVREIVERLLEESAPSGRKMEITSFSRDWFYRGATQMRSWQEQMGQAGTSIKATAWWSPDRQAAEPSIDQDTEAATTEGLESSVQESGLAVAPPEGLREEDLVGVVRVLHFTRPELAITQKQLQQLNETAAKYAPQGVSFAVVCDHASDWQAAKAWAAESQLRMPLALDAAAESDSDSNDAVAVGNEVDEQTPRPRESGVTAQNFHIRIAPVTVLIDRQGRIRATGLKLDRLESALDMLLSEPAS